MTMAAACPTFIERVDPRWVMATTTSQAASISSLRPDASDPKTRQARSGNTAPSRATEPSTLSTPTRDSPVDAPSTHCVRGAHDGPNVEVVIEVFDGDFERQGARSHVRADRLHRPIPVAVLDVAPIPVSQQLTIIVLANRPFVLPTRPRTDPDLTTGRGHCLVRGGLPTSRIQPRDVTSVFELVHGSHPSGNVE